MKLLNYLTLLIGVLVLILQVNNAVAKHITLPAEHQYSLPASEEGKEGGVIDAESLADWIKRGKGRTYVIIDTRSRKEFAEGHLHEAMNIPSSELAARVRHEIDTGAHVLVYCGYKAACERRLGVLGAMTPCTQIPLLLKGLGYKYVSYLAAEQGELVRAGFIFEQSSYSLRLAKLNEI